MPLSCKELPQSAFVYKIGSFDIPKVNFTLKLSDNYVNHWLLCVPNTDEYHNGGIAEHATKRNLV
ncbi:hypothetical protein Xentx_00976 [Xenorhabdus thuongxuanensis]|uniref:Uncharacterized protein n=1 Tax=Xenorhabdus thuongxuanensis TaxID=1873484 RepID=A0A1Q5U620_9GAMM|nr:hypothetical protein Xentx_00976 [Xenorhabdus thuongxuanensis]